MKSDLYIKRKNSRRKQIMLFWTELILLSTAIIALIVVALNFATHLQKKANNNAIGESINYAGGNGTSDYMVLSFSPEQEAMLADIEAEAELYPEELITLAQNNPDAVLYVYEYQDKMNQSFDIDLSEEAASESVPLLMQWDERWGYESYGSGLIGYTGCGPTCLSMVALYLTNNPAYSPSYVADYAMENGYYVDNTGTSWSLLSTACSAFGVSARELPLDEATMVEQLNNGHPIICAMGPGDFTDSGHFIVLTGYENGEFLVNDPNSTTRSSYTWSYEKISGQIKNLWAYSVY